MMSNRTILRIGLATAIVIFTASAWFAARSRREHVDLMLELSMSVAAELVHSTNSHALIGVTPELQSDIRHIQASATHVIVRPGDDKPPLGDGHASARLLLTNTMGETLILRLSPEIDPVTESRNFRVVGYRKTEPDGAAKQAQIPDLAESHVAANVPSTDDFRPFMIRDLTAYLKATHGDKWTVDYELLRDGPTQSGVANPKFYLWLRATNAEKTVIEGAVRVAAVDKKRFEVTDFVPRSEIVSDPDTLPLIFPQALIEKIHTKAGVKK